MTSYVVSVQHNIQIFTRAFGPHKATGDGAKRSNPEFNQQHAFLISTELLSVFDSCVHGCNELSRAHGHVRLLRAGCDWSPHAEVPLVEEVPYQISAGKLIFLNAFLTYVKMYSMTNVTAY